MTTEVPTYISERFRKLYTCGQDGGRSATEHECTATVRTGQYRFVWTWHLGYSSLRRALATGCIRRTKYLLIYVDTLQYIVHLVSSNACMLTAYSVILGNVYILATFWKRFQDTWPESISPDQTDTQMTIYANGKQRCQMVYLHTKNPNFGIFWRPRIEKYGIFSLFGSFMSIWCILWPFSCTYFPIWVCCTKKNLATTMTRTTQCARVPQTKKMNAQSINETVSQKGPLLILSSNEKIKIPA
jgi:hypothetical protein